MAKAYRESSSIRDSIEGERHLQGYLKAYLALASYYLVKPELEMNYGYCDFFLLPDKQRYPDVRHSYILELKYAARTATLNWRRKPERDVGNCCNTVRTRWRAALPRGQHCTDCYCNSVAGIW